MNHLGLTLPLKVFGSANDASRQMAALWTGGAPSLMLEQARRLGQRLPLGETYAALVQGCGAWRVGLRQRGGDQ